MMENINPLKYSSKINGDLLFKLKRSLFVFFICLFSPFGITGQTGYAQQKFDSIDALKVPPSDSVLLLELLDISRLAALESNHELNAHAQLIYCNFVFDFNNITKYDKAVHKTLDFCNDSLNLVPDYLKISALNMGVIMETEGIKYKALNKPSLRLLLRLQRFV